MTENDATAAPISPWRLPVTRSLLWFQAANGLSFPIACGLPMVLMARSWGATPFYIGVLMALSPLLTATQIFAGPRVEYWGLRRTMVLGWAARTVVLAAVVALPFISVSPNVSHALLLKILMALMILFFTLRGFGSSAWNPWLVQIIPMAARAPYLAWEQRMINIASVVVLMLCGWMLGENPGGVQYGMLFVFALATGILSVHALTRVPAIPRREGAMQLEPMKAWAPRVWKHKTLRRILRSHSMFYVAAGGADGFMGLFLRDGLGMAPQTILWIGGGMMLGAIASSGLWGAVAQRFGSKTLMMLATQVLLADWLCWALVATHILAPALWMIVLLYTMFGVGMVGYNIGANRYSMDTFPREDLALIFTLYTVASSLTAGLSPMLWGRMIDAVGLYGPRAADLTWNSYSIYFIASSAMLIATKALLRKTTSSLPGAPGLVIYSLITEVPMRSLYAMSKIIQATPGLTGKLGGRIGARLRRGGAQKEKNT